MKSFREYLPESFLAELSDGPHDTVSPIDGGQEKGPDPTMTENGKRELEVGDPVKIVGKVQFSGCTGKVDSFGIGRKFLIVNLYNHGKHSFHSSDVEFNDYDEEQDDEDHELNNLRKLAGYE